MLAPLLVSALLALQGTTPYSKRERLTMRDVTVKSANSKAGEVQTLKVDWSGTYDNPFDPADASVEATITEPGGKERRVFGFYHQGYSRSLDGGKETLKTTGPGEWLVRFFAPVEGSYSVKVSAADKSGTVSVLKTVLVGAPEKAPLGFIRISKRDGRYFEFDNGKPYFPIGANVCWAGDRGTFDFDEWFPAYGAEGANYARLWFSPEWVTFSHERKGKASEGGGLGFINQEGAWKTDYVLDLAKKNGIALMLTIDSYNILRNLDASNYWEQTAHNSDHGGPLRIWSQFWSHPEIERTYKNKLRYLAARYGAYPNVKSWEFWNEVDLTRDYEAAEVKKWHQRMATELRAYDPYDHLLTTSFSNSKGDKAIDTMPEMDYVQTHHYGTDPVGTVFDQHYRKFQYGKPHVIGEIGADWRGPNNDPTGIQIHDPMWAAIAAGSAGGAMAWWWDSLIAPKNLYKLYRGPAKFVEGVDFPGEHFQPAKFRLSLQSPPKTPVRRDLNIDSGPITWDREPINTPRTVIIAPNAVKGLPIAGTLHGGRNHPDLLNPVQFKILMPRPGKFEILVGDVSGYGGAGLRVDLNGKRVVTRNFPDPDDNTKTDTLSQFAGTIAIPLPKGEHTIVVSNPGNDWVNVSYRIRDYMTSVEVPVKVWGVVGETTVLAWARQGDRTWQRAISDAPKTMPATYASLVGLAGGTWAVEVWDTYEGTVIRTDTVRVGADGSARIALPSFQRDIAVKMRKQG